MIDLFHIGFVDISLVDVLDILVVTFIFYRLYNTLKNTVAIQIILGLILLMALYFITQAGQFNSLNWLINSLSDVWLIAFIVLFQPEIRRLLLFLLRTPLLSLFMTSNITETIDEVLEAVREMSEKHTGALIVFARQRNIKMTIDTGTQIQGKLSRELLISIFNPKSPLHDGAVIVQNGMVEAAGCILPLTTMVKYEGKNLGTRHRAALGISEQADVLALVVSEETGRISIAEEGRLTTNIKGSALEQLLRSRLNEENSTEDEKPMFSFSRG